MAGQPCPADHTFHVIMSPNQVPKEKHVSRRKAPWAAVVAVAAISATVTLAGCGAKSRPTGGEVTELRYQGSAGQVTLPELAADLGYLGNLKLKWIGNTISGPQDIQAAATGRRRLRRRVQRRHRQAGRRQGARRAVVGYYGSNEQVLPATSCSTAARSGRRAT